MLILRRAAAKDPPPSCVTDPSLCSGYMPTLMQKIRLAIRGWNRRREEKEREFLAKNVWSGGQAPSPVPGRQPGAAVLHIDVEGLTVAYLDDSGRFLHYLDIQTGEVIDTREMLND